MPIEKLPIGLWGEGVVAFVTTYLKFPFDCFSYVVLTVNGALLFLLTAVPALIWIVLIAGAAWFKAGRGLAAFAAAGLLFVLNQGLWEATMVTLALVVTATGMSLVLAIPLGIVLAESTRLRAVMFPVLDFIQTMPRFVYLIPAVVLLGIDVAPAVFATMTLAVPPPTRLTVTGLTEVDKRMVEAGESFGCNRWQLLWKVKLPLSMPAILLGANQCLMMALSMAVIASLIGAGGLGSEILNAISSLDAGKGFVAGTAIFVLAVLLNNLTLAIAVRRGARRQGSTASGG